MALARPGLGQLPAIRPRRYSALFASSAAISGFAESREDIKSTMNVVPTYRVCRRFTVESGHMLSRHPERCKYPHGHTRTVEVVVAGDRLDESGMLVDFKALKLALQTSIDRYDHAMAVNSNDPLLPELARLYPADALVVFDGVEPSTEVIAQDLFDRAACILREGFAEGPYSIPPGRVRLERVRVWETPSSWAEVGE